MEWNLVFDPETKTFTSTMVRFNDRVASVDFMKGNALRLDFWGQTFKIPAKHQTMVPQRPIAGPNF